MYSLRSLIFTVGKDTSFYGIASVLTRSISLLILPLLARHFSVEEYGLFDLLYLSLTLLVTFFIFGQDSSILRYFYDENDDDSRRALVTNSVSMIFLLSIIFLFIIFLLENFFKNFFQITSEDFNLILILLMIVPFGILYAISETVLRITSNLKGYLALSLGLTLSILITVFYATQILNASLYLLFKMYFYVWLVFGLFGLFLIRKWIQKPQTIVVPKKMFLYGLPMGIVVMLEVGQPVFERLIISNLIGLEGLGLYAVATKIAMFMILPVGAFQMAFMPTVMKIYKDKDAIKLFNLSLTIYIAILSIILLSITAMSENLIYFLAGPSYMNADSIIFPLTMAIYLHAIAMIIGIGTIISQKTYIRLIILVIVQIISLALMIILSSKYDIYGVAVGVCIGKIILFFIYGYVGQKLYPLRWNYKMLIVVIFATFIFGFFISNIKIDSLIEIFFFIVSLIIILFISWSFLTVKDKSALKIFD